MTKKYAKRRYYGARPASRKVAANPGEGQAAVAGAEAPAVIKPKSPASKNDSSRASSALPAAYIKSELVRIGILAVVIIVILVVLAILLT